MGRGLVGGVKGNGWGLCGDGKELGVTPPTDGIFRSSVLGGEGEKKRVHMSTGRAGEE